MKKIFASISLLLALCLQAQQPLCFTEYTVTPVANMYPTVADFNNDGFDDIVSYPGSQVLFGQGNGSFIAGPLFASLIANYNVTAADFNGDGNMDICMQVLIPNRLFFSYGNGAGGFVRDSLVIPFLSSYIVKDFDGDGKSDLLATHNNTMAAQIYRSLGNGSFALVNALNSFTNTTSLAFEDFNGDNYIDIFAITGGNAAIYQGNQSMVYTNSVSVPGISSSTGLHFNDYDKDGKTDIFIIGNGVITKKALNNFAFGSTAFSLGSTQFTNAVYFADLNSDGLNDLLWPVGNNSISYALNSGAGFSSITSYTYSIISNVLVTALLKCSFNADNKDDLLIVTTDFSPWSTAKVLINCNETSIDDNFLSDFKIFPQPASSSLTLQFEGLELDGAMFLELYSVAGSRMDVPVKVGHNKVEVDVSSLPTGIYFLSISNNNQQSLVKKKIAIVH
jgi:hypothetical protein